ncbi:hypothetical protein [Lactobacillus taiwanensis]|uniref:hypothetical protein n=1 Tax=Lactobacillus taiwanensis TaxID=508451 RepID=UPI00321FCE92
MKKVSIPPVIVMELRNNPKYNGLSGLAKSMYDYYAHRAKCSAYHAKNGDNRYIDKKGVFIYYSNEDICELLSVSDRTVSKFRKQLINAGLIEVVRDGLTSYKIYVKEPEKTPDTIHWRLKPNVEEVYEDGDVVTGLENDNTVENIDQITEEKEIPSRPEKIAGTSRKKVTLSASHYSSRETNVTKETGKVEKISPTDSLQTQEELALEGLKDRVSGIVGIRVWGKIRMIAQDSYDKAKELVDIIYKAKKQVSQRVRSICKQYWDLPEISDAAYDSVYFEKNDLLAKGIESALVRIIEIHYKSERSEIKNLNGFIYTFLRNSLSQNVELYIEERTNGYHCLQDVAQYIHNTLNFRAV